MEWWEAIKGLNKYLHIMNGSELTQINQKNMQQYDESE